MKNIYSIIVVILFSFLSLTANAQISDDELGEFTNKEDYLRDFEKLRMRDLECCGETPNLTFFYTPFSTQTNHDLIMEARIRAHHAWFNRQYEGFKKEIEKQLKKTYPNFEQAQNEFYKHVEKKNVLANHGVVEKKYKKKVKARKVLKDESLRNLKLLELRRKELIIGNINNTNYGSFNYNGTPIGDIKNVSQLNTLKEQEISTFGTNEWKLQDDDDVYRYLRSDLSQMWNYDNTNNYDYAILRKLSELQMHHFNRFGSWQQLDLMQMYLNDVRMPLVMVQQIHAGDFGTAQFIENYVVRLRSGGESIFDPKYFDYLFDMHSEEYYEEAYAANGGGLTEEELEEVTGNIIREIEEIVTDEREDYINDLLGDISEEDIKIINNLTGKAKCVYDKLTNSSTGFSDAIKKFDGEFPVSHLKFSSDSNMPSNTKKAHTIPPTNFVIEIVLNGNSSKDASYQKRPNLMVAKTIIHEVIHAEMWRKILSIINNGGNVNGLTAEEWTSKLSNGDYPGIFDYYTRFGVNGFQHPQMAAHYRDVIADALEDFDNNNNSRQFYEDIAWEGLIYRNDPTWNSLSSDEKERIDNVIETYINQNINESCE